MRDETGPNPATPDEMRAEWDWRHAWYQAEHGDYGPSYDTDETDCKSSLNNVTDVIAAVSGENDGPDWLCVVKLDDGRFATMRAGCDYTGWD